MCHVSVLQNEGADLQASAKPENCCFDDLAAKLGRRAAELAREKFSVDKMVKATENFYERILAESQIKPGDRV